MAPNLETIESLLHAKHKWSTNYHLFPLFLSPVPDETFFNKGDNQNNLGHLYAFLKIGMYTLAHMGIRRLILPAPSCTPPPPNHFCSGCSLHHMKLQILIQKQTDPRYQEKIRCESHRKPSRLKKIEVASVI